MELVRFDLDLLLDLLVGVLEWDFLFVSFPFLFESFGILLACSSAKTVFDFFLLGEALRRQKPLLSFFGVSRESLARRVASSF